MDVELRDNHVVIITVHPSQDGQRASGAYQALMSE
jgi:hypothetical protein